MDKKVIMHFNRTQPTRVRYGVVSGSTALAIGIVALAGGAVAGGMALAGGSSEKPAPSVPSAPALPAAPTGAEASESEKSRIRRKTRTILTAPLEEGEDFGKAAPTLLGSGDVTKKTTLG